MINIGRVSVISRPAFALLSLFFPLNWGPRYFERGKSPSRLELSLLTTVLRGKAILSRSIQRRADEADDKSSASEMRLQRRYAAFTVPEPPLEDSVINERPSIRLLWMVHPKDFRVLHHSVEGVLRHLKNPVHEIVFISPKSERTEAHLQSKIEIEPSVRFFNDDDFMSSENWQKLAGSISGHAGWAASQLIKVNFILTGDSTPTLIVDSDTVLLEDKQWLYSDGRQLLYFRWYENPRYEKYLRHWGFRDIDPLRSFITHHTLFQPQLLRELMDSLFGSHDLDTLVNAVADGSSALGFPEFCIDDEPYGQLLFKYHRDDVVLDKYSNTNLSLPETDELMIQTLQKLRRLGKFNSVSFHNPDR